MEKGAIPRFVASVFDNERFRNIVQVLWEHLVCNDNVQRCVLGEGIHVPSEVIASHGLQHIGNVLRMLVHHLPFRVLLHMLCRAGGSNARTKL